MKVWNRRRWALTLGAAVVAGACGHDTTSPEARTPIAGTQINANVGTANLTPTRDTYILDGSDHANRGGLDTMRVRTTSGSDEHALIAFDSAAIAGYVGRDSLVSATLELTIRSTHYIRSYQQYLVRVHRMTRDWTELGATWQCPNDVNTSNSTLDCPGGSWSMTGNTLPYAAAATDSSLIDSAQTQVSYNVTADVRAFLSGTPNYGWMLLSPQVAPPSPDVEFWARESASAPVLRIVTVAGDGGGGGTPDSSCTHEPSGYSLKTQTSFTTAGEDGWSTTTDPDFGYVDDATALRSPTKVGRITFLSGFKESNPPARTSKEFTTSQRPKNLYVCTWVKVSSNWQSHPIVSKIGYMFTGGDANGADPKLYWGLVPKDSMGIDSLYLRLRLQNMNVHTSPSDNLSNNLSRGYFSRGAWHKVEILAKVNTWNQADGEAYLWLDGQAVASATNLNWNGDLSTADPTTTDRNNWRQVDWEPVWGGDYRGADSLVTVKQTQYMDMDHYYASGGN